MNRPSPLFSVAKAAFAAAVSLAPAVPVPAADAAGPDSAAHARLVRQRVLALAFFAPSAPQSGDAGSIVRVMNEDDFVIRARQIAAAHPAAMEKVGAFVQGLSRQDIDFLNAFPFAVSERAGANFTHPFSELTAAYPVSNDPAFLLARSAAMSSESLYQNDVAAFRALLERSPTHPALEKAVAFTRDFAADPDCLALVDDLSLLLKSRKDSWENDPSVAVFKVLAGGAASVGVLAFLAYLVTKTRSRRAA